MASKQTYECFVCKKNGFPDTRVYLDGKTDDGKTIYKNEDMSAHQHKSRTGVSTTVSDSRNAQESRSESPTINAEPQLKIINAKLDRLIALIEQKQSTTK